MTDPEEKKKLDFKEWAQKIRKKTQEKWEALQVKERFNQLKAKLSKKKSEDADFPPPPPGDEFESKPKGRFDFRPMIHWVKQHMGRVKESGLARSASKLTVDDILRYKYAWKTALVLGGAAAGGHLATSIIGDIFSDRKPPKVPSFAQAKKQVQGRRQLLAYKNIYQKPIFDREAYDPTGGPTATGEYDLNSAVPTKLPIELVGTIVLGRDHLSIASIRDKSSGKVEAYQKDEAIGKHPATLYKVTFRKVYLVRQGKLEYIESKEIKGFKIATSTPAPKKSVTGIQKEDDNNFTISAKWKDDQISNISEIVTQARAIPHFENGQITGFRIINIKKGGVFDQLGITEGDIVEEVNDIPLSNQGQALGLFNQLKDMSDGTVTIVVNRNGQQIVKNYNVR